MDDTSGGIPALPSHRSSDKKVVDPLYRERTATQLTAKQKLNTLVSIFRWVPSRTVIRCSATSMHQSALLDTG